MTTTSHPSRAAQSGEQHIRLMLVDDHALFRQSLARYLAAQPDFEVAGDYGATSGAMNALQGSPVDVVLLDLDLGAERGIDLIAAARSAGYRARFLIVTGAEDPKGAAAALKLGASGVFRKSEPPNRLVEAIRMVAGGAAWVDREIVRRLADRYTNPASQPAERNEEPLDDRQQKVLDGIMAGMTNREIGLTSGISEGSVKHIVQRLFSKVGVRTRSQLVRATLEGSLRSKHER